MRWTHMLVISSGSRMRNNEFQIVTLKSYFGLRILFTKCFIVVL